MKREDIVNAMSLEDAIQVFRDTNCYGTMDIARTVILRALESKTGHWIESKGHDDRDHFYICSECGRYINLICGAKLSDYPYCHCGAKMESEK